MAAVVVLAPVMASCTDESSPAPPGATGTPIPVETTPLPSGFSPSPSPAPVLPSAAAQPTRAGAEAFIRYFFDVYQYSFTIMDPAPLRVVSAPDCDFCNSTIRAVDGGRQKSRRSVGHGIEIRAIVAAPGKSTTGVLVNIVFDQKAARTIASDGSVVALTPEKRNIRMDMIVRWVDGRWLLLDAAFPEVEGK